MLGMYMYVCSCLCVNVWVRERTNESERVRDFERQGGSGIELVLLMAKTYKDT